MILYGKQVFYEVALLKIIHPVLGVCLKHDMMIQYFICFCLFPVSTISQKLLTWQSLRFDRGYI